jgi:hypothetical protein
MHFLKKVVENPDLEKPAENHMEVHRHFNRYSRGTFSGPAIKIKKYSTKLTLKGSLEYEDIIQEIVIRTLNDGEIDVKGKVISIDDISFIINQLNLNWNLKESTGKIKKYKAEFNDKLNKEKLLKAIEEFRKNSFLLLSFNKNKYCRVSTKTSLPRPSKKNPIDDNIDKKVSFCSGYIINNDNNLEMVINELLPDFRDELPKEWDQFSLTNTYNINEIKIPKNINDSKMLRIMAIRKGKLIRNLQINDQVIEKQYSITV